MIKHRFMQLKIVLLIFCGLFVSIQSSAQIGYQISLLDTKTGEPRTNERVNVSVKISDSKGSLICDETLSATSDAFGVLSLTIGDASTFANVDWQNMPLNVSTTVDGILIGSSDILTVPIAEYAKTTGTLTKELLCSKTWSNGFASSTIEFRIDGTGTMGSKDFHYSIDNNFVILEYVSEGATCGHVFIYNKDTKHLVDTESRQYVYR